MANGKGTDLEKVDLPSELRCPICNTYFKEAVMIPCCQHSFCKKCKPLSSLYVCVSLHTYLTCNFVSVQASLKFFHWRKGVLNVILPSTPWNTCYQIYLLGMPLSIFLNLRFLLLLQKMICRNMSQVRPIDITWVDNLISSSACLIL